jgi:uracil phosphoribosyltransferase
MLFFSNQKYFIHLQIKSLSLTLFYSIQKMVTILGKDYSILSDILAELRDISVQTDREKFRNNVTKVGELMAYEISKNLPFLRKHIQTPLGVYESMVLAQQPVIATVLRAGLQMHQGFMNYFSKADAAYISAYRKHINEHEFEVKVDYLASPDITNRVLILVDPMLATGRSLELSYQAIINNGTPNKVIIASLIASEEGLAYLTKILPHADIYIAAVDPQLDENSYIVPGLGDAGDLCFGEKL